MGDASTHGKQRTHQMIDRCGSERFVWAGGSPKIPKDIPSVVSFGNKNGDPVANF